MSQTIYYAIGDVHGEDDRLAALHDGILSHHQAAHAGAPAVIVHLGDLIDRGADSRSVIQRCMAMERDGALPEGVRVVTIKGNHESMMVDAIRSGRDDKLLHWLENGGDATLASYLREIDEPGEEPLAHVDAQHVRWLGRLPTFHHDPGRRLFFVHGGIEPATFPECSDEVRLWTRSERFFDERQWPDRPELANLLVVHGHTPTRNSKPDWWPRRLNIDTGAVFGGPLTCAILAPGAPPRFLTA